MSDAVVGMSKQHPEKVKRRNLDVRGGIGYEQEASRKDKKRITSCCIQ